MSPTLPAASREDSGSANASPKNPRADILSQNSQNSQNSLIAHVDMDAFYASVEERDNPDLVGRPVVVGGSAEGRGVVAAANYQARRYGVHSAMPAAMAKRLCPHAVFLPSRIEHYAQVSTQIHNIFERFTPLVEPLALDEAFLDMTGSERLFGLSKDIGLRLKAEIESELGLVASVGVAPNKFLAKVASGVCKPNAVAVVCAESVHSFLDPLPVAALWGIGPVSARALREVEIETVGALRVAPHAKLRSCLGNATAHILRLANGVDHRRVVPDRQAKSIGHETTFDIDVTDHRFLRSVLLGLTEHGSARLRRADLLARRVVLKLRRADFRTYTHSESLLAPTQSTGDLWEVVHRVFSRSYRGEALRLVGVAATALVPHSAQQLDLFAAGRQRQGARLDEVVDAVNARFGLRTLGRLGSSTNRD